MYRLYCFQNISSWLIGAKSSSLFHLFDINNNYDDDNDDTIDGKSRWMYRQYWFQCISSWSIGAKSSSFFQSFDNNNVAADDDNDDDDDDATATDDDNTIDGKSRGMYGHYWVLNISL